MALSIHTIIPVLSGKGGVGKSTVAVQLARFLARQGHRVGVLDVDLCGPSVPRLLNVHREKVRQSPSGWIPVPTADSNLVCMSIAFLLEKDTDSVVWRGPKKNAMIKQFLYSVAWGQLDYLIVDTPPGTSDEHLAIAEYLGTANNLAAVLVTTPQALSLIDLLKEITFCQKLHIPILGLIENMSGFECTRVFSVGGGQSLADKAQLHYLGAIPLDPTFSTLEGPNENFEPIGINIQKELEKTVSIG